jgi:hypothetical protein
MFDLSDVGVKFTKYGWLCPLAALYKPDGSCTPHWTPMPESCNFSHYGFITLVPIFIKLACIPLGSTLAFGRFRQNVVKNSCFGEVRDARDS